MPEFTVVSSSKKKEFPAKDDKPAMQVIALRLAQDGNAAPVEAEWFTRATTDLPMPGSKLDGDLEPGQYGMRFKKSRPNNGFGGGRRDPATEKRIVHQHSQDMAIETLKLAHQMGVAPEVENVKALVDAVEAVADVYDRKAWEAA